MTRLGNLTRAFAVIGTAPALMLALAGAPAHAAATEIFASHSITVPGLVRHQIDVHLAMSQAEARHYIGNRAKIEIECYGSDTFVDERLAGVPGGYSHTFTGSPHPQQPAGYGVLVATPTGVHLTTLNLYEKGEQLNEDFGDRDEVYCKARWIDGQGATLRYTTSQQRGYY